MCSDLTGNIYIPDSGMRRVFKFNSNGKFLNEIGKKGKGPGELDKPFCCACTRDDNLLVYDWGNNRIQFFDKNGKYLKGFKVYNSIVVDDLGFIYVSPAYRSYSLDSKLIEVFEDDGKLVRSFGKKLILNIIHHSLILLI